MWTCLEDAGFDVDMVGVLWKLYIGLLGQEQLRPGGCVYFVSVDYDSITGVYQEISDTSFIRLSNHKPPPDREGSTKKSPIRVGTKKIADPGGDQKKIAVPGGRLKIFEGFF